METPLHKKRWGNGDPLHEIISGLPRQRLIVNSVALRADYLPSSLPHRWDHIRRVGQVLAPCLGNGRPSNVLIYGKTGTGKTAVVKHVLERFSAEAVRRGLRSQFTYVNCRIAGTEYRVLSELCSSLGVRVPFTGLSKAEVFSRLRSSLQGLGSLMVACLDEVDVLVKGFGDDVLYELTRSNDASSPAQISLIGISNDLTFKEQLDPRVLSSLGEEEIVFHPYTAPELVDILRERAEMALRKDAIRSDIINLCAALAAAEHGDARRALDLLRVAAEVAEREGADAVEVKHVRAAQGLIERGRIHEALSSLPIHSRVVLLSAFSMAKKKEALTSGVLYTTYRSLCGRVGLEPLTDRRVSTLVSELDMLGVLSCDLVSFGRHGRTRRIRLSIGLEEIGAVLEGDDLLAPIVKEMASNHT